MPDADRWDRLETLFEAAAAQPPEAREAFVRARATDADGQPDDALAAEVLSLLAHADAADADWGESVQAFADSLFDDGDLHPGLAVGPYVLERPLGRGGMGTVWRAHPADDAGRAVALKILRRGIDTADVRRRFRQEQRVLGRLDHPGIARLFDGGVTPDGLPFVAMELVDGEPIDAYCDRRRLGVPERLALFAQVCEAVQYAHQRLVVHRDLKPSNVLVAETPRGPRTKLLDFGIAKVLAPDDLGLTGLVTRAGQRLLTPAYASPEQLRGEVVTTASDVFQLGGLLYELLTGRPPTVSQRIPAEPARPSDVVRETATRARPDGTTVTLSPEAVSEARRVAPERLRRTLAGDLDTIVLTALHAEPARRYDSASALADDVGRHLAGEAVRARRPTLGYRAGRFVRRHRAGVAAAAVAVLALAGFAAAMTASRAEAAREAATARATADVLAGLFSAANPTQSGGDTLTVLTVLGQAETRVRTELAGEPEVLAAVLRAIGLAYRDLTRFDRAGPPLADALALRRAAFGPADARTEESLADLGTLRYMEGDLYAALALARERLAVLRALHGPRSPETARAWGDAARAHLQAKQLDSARAALDAGLALTRPRAADAPERHLGLVGLEGWYAAEVGDHEASVRVAREILALHHRTAAPALSVALAERILGDQLAKAGRPDSGLVWLDRSQARYRRVLGPGSRYEALIAGHAAEAHAALGQTDRADSLFRAALDLRTRHFGADSREASRARDGLVGLRAAQ